MNPWEENIMNYVWREILKPMREKIINGTASEVPVYEIPSHGNKYGHFLLFGPGSDTIGCIAIEDDIEEGAKIIFMFNAPQNRVVKGGNWNYNLERCWKAGVKDAVVEIISRRDVLSNGVLIYWDPYYEYEEGDHKLNDRYRFEYVEEITGDVSNLKDVLEYDIYRRLEQSIIGNEAQYRRDS